MDQSLKRLAGPMLDDLPWEIRYAQSSKQPMKILFDHIPKCVGSTWNMYLQKHYPRRKIFTLNSRNPNAFKFLS